MASYLIKSILCSGILILVYRLFLEKEKMHLFNRYYLLLALLFSLIVPLISIEIRPEMVIEPIANMVPEMIERIGPTNNTEQLDLISEPPSFDLTNYIPSLFCLIAFLLLIRYSRNIFAILKLKSKCKVISLHEAKLVLVPQDIITYTFLKNIFIPEKTFQNEKLRNEILTHELAHARQMHSLDILFIELVHALMWFNPFLFFYKKAIRLNHEFLADEAVLKEHADVRSYQLLLLDTIRYQQQVSLTSNFNYSITKKRLAMMTKIRNLNAQYVKQFAIALLAFVLTFIFSDKIYAQVKTSSQLVAQALPEIKIIAFDQKLEKIKSAPQDRKSSSETKSGPGISQSEEAEFYNTIEKHTTYVTNKKGRIDPIVKMAPKLEDKMHALYTKMNSEQLKMMDDSGIVVFQMPIPIKKAPDKEMFENWKKPSVFGVWINDKHVPNAELNKYKASDIAEYWLSKLYGAALKGRSYKYQLDLTTNERFDKTYEKRINDRIFIGRVGWVGERPKSFGKLRASRGGIL